MHMVDNHLLILFSSSLCEEFTSESETKVDDEEIRYEMKKNAKSTKNQP